MVGRSERQDIQLLRIDSLPDLLAQKMSRWRCVSSASVAWRSSAAFDQRLQPLSGPERGTVIEAEQVKGEKVNWLRVSTNSSLRFLPITSLDGEVLFVKEATAGTVKTSSFTF